MYVDYEFYLGRYGGERIGEEEFKQLEVKASVILDYFTFNRVREFIVVDDLIKLAVCELMDYLNGLKDAGGKTIVQENVAGHSITYSQSEKSEQSMIIQKYLGHTGLMYRGSRQGSRANDYEF